MKNGNRRAAWMVGAVMVLGGLAAPSQAAVSAGNILAAPVKIDNAYRQDLRVQMAAADARTGTAKPAVETGTDDGQVVASDQLNDVDRALHEQTPVAPVAIASNDAQAMRSASTIMAANDHSVWDETSLIGKVFIAFGTLLTFASAARMFMA
jgi:ABC-type sugar transport system substrate-binding protein